MGGHPPSMSASNYCIRSRAFIVMQQWFSALPLELQIMIFSLLDQNTLTSCARVSKSWNEIATPLLWMTVNVHTCKQLEILLEDESRQALYRNACSIHSLTLCLDHWTLLNTLVPQYAGVRIAHCSNIRSLEIRCAKHSISSPVKLSYLIDADEQGVGALKALLRWNPRLISLIFQSGTISPSILLTATSETSGLQSLYIGASIPVFVARDVLNSLPSSIKSVTMHLTEFNLAEVLAEIEVTEHEQDQEQHQDEEMQQNSDVPKEKPSKPHKALETLQIYGVFTFLERYLFLPFLETCSSKLVNLDCPATRFFLNRDVNAALAKIGHFLEQLGPGDLPDGPYSTDADIAQVIVVHTRLRSIDLEGCKNMATLTAGAILEICEQYLQELHIGGCGNFASKDLQAILCKARRLEKLVAIDKYNALYQNPTLLAKDISGSVWATSSLRHFECRIITDPSGHKGSQRKVFQQLGAQSNLERLILGHPLNPIFNSPPFQQDCLDLTLESGLEELECLVNLQELSVMSLAHGIGVPELEWMVLHWPRLKMHHMFFCHVPFVKSGACKWISYNLTI